MSRVIAVALSLGVVVPAAAQAPVGGGRCDIIFTNTPETRFNTVQVGGAYDTYLGGGVVANCRGQDVHLRADSAEYYERQQLVYLIGNVRYTEPRLALDSERLRYFMPEERLHAEGNVDAVLPSGTRMRGPQAEYFRAVRGVRERSRMVAIGRPTISLVQRDSAGRPQEPVDVIANRVVMEADSLVYASGRVELTRPDVRATGDSAFLDSGREVARLRRDPRIEGKGERPFVLTGTIIDLFSRNRQVERVLSAGSATAVSGDLELRSDTLDLRLTDSRLERAFAWGPSRALAVTETSELSADSLDIIMPGQQLKEIRALRRAVAHSDPDSTRIRSDERDWLRGDTILAFFEPPPEPVRGEGSDPAPADTSRQPRIRRLVARGDARSFYQVPPEQAEAAAPGINYVRGGEITVAFADGGVQTVTVDAQAIGLYLEPVIERAAEAADRLRGQPDAAGDTTRVSPPPTPTPAQPPATPRRPERRP